MVGITALLAEAQAVGLTLRADGDTLVIRGQPRYEPIAKALLTHRAEIPAEWIAGVAALSNMTPPAGVSQERWATLIADAGGFLEKWRAQPSRLGWSTLDLFGANQVKPFVRVDGVGLIRLLDGRSVVALTEHEAVFECSTGSRQTYRRKPPGAVTARCCLLWEIADGPTPTRHVRDAL